VPTSQAIVDGIRRMPDPRRCVARLGPSWTIFERAEAPPEARERLLHGRRGDAALAGGRSAHLRDLITMGPGDLGANAKLLYAFWVLRLITRARFPSSGIRRIQWKTPGGVPSADWRATPAEYRSGADEKDDRRCPFTNTSARSAARRSR